MKKMHFHKLFILIFVLFIGTYAKATHIVGGVMNYRYLGNDQYEISLYVYRDCVNGIPPLDDPAIIRIWDGVTETYKETALPFDSILDPGQPDACARIEADVCVNWTRYKDTLILPPNDLGYIIYYQRCCRNNTIQNLTYDSRGNGAMDWGATYTVNIPPAVNNQHINNNSPYFVNYPPVYICVNKPIIYDNRAIDTDGDSLVYRLCTPYSGAFPDDPSNWYTSETPPFENVVWEPPYSLTNVLGGIPLAINSSTGLLTGTPNSLGQFVVGVCVDEYRNGEILTRTSRDFQFNIIDCNLQVVSSFFAPTIQCNDFTINFQNQSTGATSYKWYFGDGDSSDLQNPTHTYADTGKYTVTLVSINAINPLCLGTYSQVVSVQYKKINADFIANSNSCLAKNDTIYFTDKSTDTLNIISWKWSFSTGDSSSLQNPFILYDGNSNSITATLLVTSINGCTSSITKTINLFKKEPYTLDSIITKCSNVSTAQISLTMNGNNIFNWSPATGLNNPNIQNPTTNTSNNITYYVTIKTPLPNGDTCVQRDSVHIKMINTVQINASDTIRVCKDSVRLNVPLSAGQTVVWSTSNTFSPIIGTTATISILQTSTIQKYYVKITAQGCEVMDSIVAIYNDTIPTINLLDNILQCNNQVSITANINYSDQISWSTSPTFTPIISSTNTYTGIQIPKTAIYYVKANYRTCFNTDSIKITVQDTIPIISLEDSMSVCGGLVSINASVRKYTSLIWSTSPDFSTVLGNSTYLDIAQTTPRQVYYIKAFYRNCFVTDSIIVIYGSTYPIITLADSTTFCSNRVTITANITNASAVTWSINSNYNPILSTQNSFTLNQNNTYQTYYVKASNGACITTDSIKIKTDGNPLQININDTILVCADSVRLIGNILNYDSIKWSYNSIFTDIFATTPNIIIAQTIPEKMYYVKAYYLDCEVTDSFRVLYNDVIPSISLYNKTNNCIGLDKNNIVKLEAIVDFYNSFIWAKDRDFDSIITTNNLAFQIQQNDTGFWYYFKAKYKQCETIDSIYIKHPIINLPTDLKVCFGDIASINLEIIGSNEILLIRWKTNDSTITSGYNIKYIEFNPTLTTYIYVNAYTRWGCEVINDSILITVNPLPVIDATVDKPIINLGDQVQLNVTQGQNYTYNWTPINLVSNNTIYNPVSSPTQNTVYTVIVTNANLCNNQDTVSVRISDNECNIKNIYIPNAFTPNGDGKNDVFKVNSTILKSMYLEVYDRWGNKVFESNSITDVWDGTYKNKPAPLEAYGYYFTGECFQGEKVTLKGNVTLLK
jgi:gliding motility-associated-like protein